MKILQFSLLALLGLASTNNAIYANKSKHSDFTVTVDKNLSAPWVRVDIWSQHSQLSKREKHHSEVILKNSKNVFHILKDHSISKIIITYPNGTQRRKSDFYIIKDDGDAHKRRNSVVKSGKLFICDTPGDEAVITTQKGVKIRVSPGKTKAQIEAMQYTLQSNRGTNNQKTTLPVDLSSDQQEEAAS